ncbi:MAG: cyclic pyranopterin monophosphate synthase MoaC [Lachnospiraceae bacterium]|nr:cyclic pyranopterin monophosphate synthase MoaC [Lachnospiraceae bacterium]
MDNKLSHINEQGHARMVNVTEKAQTVRTAIAKGEIYMAPETLDLIQQGGMPKGDVIAVAQVAGIMAAKKTGDLIPMCHPINLTGVDLSFDIDTEKSRIVITSTVSCKGETGVEMEALTAVSAAALTIYDMCKAVQKDMHIEGIKLLKKTGGKSGDYIAKD